MRWARIPWQEKQQQLEQWHQWFAWYPVQVGAEMVWGEYVWRKFHKEGWNRLTNSFCEYRMTLP